MLCLHLKGLEGAGAASLSDGVMRGQPQAVTVIRARVYALGSSGEKVRILDEAVQVGAFA